MKKRILVLGAGFGGLELSTMLSEAFGDGIEVTLIDKNDSFYFGYSKLDVMFGHAKPNAVRLPYKEFVKPGVRLLQETISSVDPIAKRVTTNRGVHEADDFLHIVVHQVAPQQRPAALVLGIDPVPIDLPSGERVGLLDVGPDMGALDIVVG